MRKTFPYILNSILFIAGISFLLFQLPVLCAVCFLLDSLLSIWTFQTEGIPGPPPSTVESAPDTDGLSAALSRQLEELTESSRALSAENQRLTAEQNQLWEKLSSQASALYTCPLTASLPVHLDTFFADYLNCHPELMENGSIHPDYNCSAPDAATYLSPAALTLICNNVFDNILKFSPKTAPALIRITAIENDCLIIFKNEGDGPEEPELAKLFDLNYQGANRKSGSGLGLAQVKALVDDFGGQVWAKSPRCAGFALYIRLPEYPCDRLS